MPAGVQARLAHRNIGTRVGTSDVVHHIKEDLPLKIPRPHRGRARGAAGRVWSGVAELRRAMTIYHLVVK
jgi:hypothetical protein